jgi:hypothetical protein
MLIFFHAKQQSSKDFIGAFAYFAALRETHLTAMECFFK